MKYFLALFFVLLFTNKNLLSQTNNWVKYNAMPKNFVIKLDTTKILFNNQIQKNKPTVVMFFNPDCDHCEIEIKEITKQMNLLKNIQFILVSNRPIFLLKPFVKKYGLSKFSNIKVCCSFDNSIFRFYGIGSFPSMVIYNNKQIVTQKYENSMVAISDILKWTKN